MVKWTIELSYPIDDEIKGKTRAKCCFWVDAENIQSAYAIAEKSLIGREGYKLGFIIPGHHNILPGFKKK